MLKPLTAATLLAFLAACGTQESDPAPPPPPLEGAAIGGAFELLDTSGNPVAWSDFDGKYRMVYFGYAYCPDVCPFDVQRMMKGFDSFKKTHPDLAAQVQPLFISIDPERDTPEVVAEFTSAFSEDLLGLTGSAEQVDGAAKAFAVYYAKGDVNSAGGYLMDHSRAAYLMGKEGQPIALLPVDESAEGVATELEKWVS